MNIFRSEECVVCLEPTEAPIFVPCNHACCCPNCCKEIVAAKMPCPLCRQIISETRVFVLPDLDTTTAIPEAEIVEFKQERKADYIAQMRKAVTSNAGFIGKSKLAKSVGSEVLSQLDERVKENAGTARISLGKKVQFERIGYDTLAVTYKIGRKEHHESVSYMDWNDARSLFIEGLDGDKVSLVDFATHYPEYYWTWHYHNNGNVEEAMADAEILQTKRRRK